MNFGVDHPRAAVVAIDLHRGHLDMAVATMPTTPDVAARIIAANKRLFDWCRSVDIPIIHQVTSYRDAEEIRANPFWRTRAEDPNATRKNVMRHNIIGGPGCTVMPQLLDAARLRSSTPRSATTASSAPTSISCCARTASTRC